MHQCSPAAATLPDDGDAEGLLLEEARRAGRNDEGAADAESLGLAATTRARRTAPPSSAPPWPSLTTLVPSTRPGPC